MNNINNPWLYHQHCLHIQNQAELASVEVRLLLGSIGGEKIRPWGVPRVVQTEMDPLPIIFSAIRVVETSWIHFEMVTLLPLLSSAPLTDTCAVLLKFLAKSRKAHMVIAFWLRVFWIISMNQSVGRFILYECWHKVSTFTLKILYSNVVIHFYLHCFENKWR